MMNAMAFFDNAYDLDVVIILIQEESFLAGCPFCCTFTWSDGPKHFPMVTCCLQTARVFEHEQITRQATQAKDIVSMALLWIM